MTSNHIKHSDHSKTSDPSDEQPDEVWRAAIAPADVLSVLYLLAGVAAVSAMAGAAFARVGAPPVTAISVRSAIAHGSGAATSPRHSPWALANCAVSEATQRRCAPPAPL